MYMYMVLVLNPPRRTNGLKDLECFIVLASISKQIAVFNHFVPQIIFCKVFTVSLEVVSIEMVFQQLSMYAVFICTSYRKFINPARPTFKMLDKNKS